MRAAASNSNLLSLAVLVGAASVNLSGCSSDPEADALAGTAGLGGASATGGMTSGGITSGGEIVGTGAIATATTGAATSGNATAAASTFGDATGSATTAAAAISGATTASAASTGAITTGDATTSGGTGGGAATTGSETTGNATTGDAATTGAETTGNTTTGNAGTTGGATTGSATTGGMPPDNSDLVGWAAVSECGPNGTTGGGNAAPITVTDTASLKAAMNSSEPQVIYVSGRIQTPGNISGRHNKTLIGINNAEIHGGWGLVGCTNIIVQNIRFTDGPNDSFGLSGSACIWLDHCEFVDGTDGNLDVVNGTDFVTISWSRFYYTRGHDHMFANLVGNTQPHEGDVGRENITYHHNWWGAGVESRKPRVRYGQVHIFNNYYHYTPVSGDGGDDYDIGAGFQSKLLVENNYFDGSNEPITWMSDEGTAQVVERNNEFVGAGSVVTRGSAFDPPYEYQHVMEPAAQVKDSVLAGAGIQ